MKAGSTLSCASQVYARQGWWLACLAGLLLLTGCGTRAAASTEAPVTPVSSAEPDSSHRAVATPAPLAGVAVGDSPLAVPSSSSLAPAGEADEDIAWRNALAHAVQRVSQRTRMGFLSPLEVTPDVAWGRGTAPASLNLPLVQSGEEDALLPEQVDAVPPQASSGLGPSLTRVAQSATALSEGLAEEQPAATPTPLSLAELLARPVPGMGSQPEPETETVAEAGTESGLPEESAGVADAPDEAGTAEPAQEHTGQEEAIPPPAMPVEPAPAASDSAPPLAPTPVWSGHADGENRSVRVPILMYHYLSVPPPGADAIRTDLSVTPERFAAHLDALQANGYTTISLHQLHAHLAEGAPLPERPIVLTFDDGYRDNYENAFPLLRARGMTATFFIVTDFINDGLPGYLNWDMVREMYAGGMSIEAHGRNHVSLRGRDVDFLVWQALGNRESIELAIGVPPRFISYPAGQYDERTIEIYASANFWGGLTTVQGATHTTDKLFEMNRVRVRYTTTPEELLRLAALDW